MVTIQPSSRIENNMVRRNANAFVTGGASADGGIAASVAGYSMCMWLLLHPILLSEITGKM